MPKTFFIIPELIDRVIYFYQLCVISVLFFLRHMQMNCMFVYELLSLLVCLVKRLNITYLLAHILLVYLIQLITYS